MLNGWHLLQGPSGANRGPRATPGEAGHKSHGGPEPVTRAHLRGGRNRDSCPVAAVMMAQSPGSCCWKRKGCEAHLSESRAAVSLPANWAGPRGEGSPRREGESGPGGASRVVFFGCGSAVLSALVVLPHKEVGESRALVYRERELPSCRVLLQHPTPTPTTHT